MKKLVIALAFLGVACLCAETAEQNRDLILKTAMAEFVQTCTTILKDGVNLVKDEMPQILREKLIFARWSVVVDFSSSLAICLSAFFVANYYRKVFNQKIEDEKSSWARGDYEIGHILLCVAMGASILVFLIIISAAATEWIKPFVAPRLYLMEYIASLI